MELDLRRADVDAEGAAALSIGRLSRLRVLCLKDNELAVDGIRALGNGAGLPALEELDLWQTRLEDAGVAALVGGVAHRPRERPRMTFTSGGLLRWLVDCPPGTTSVKLPVLEGAAKEAVGRPTRGSVVAVSAYEPRQAGYARAAAGREFAVK